MSDSRKDDYMTRGKLIVIEGTDCSGKETQSDLLVKRLKEENINIEKFSFPNYDTPTGRIVGGPFLGKEYIGECWFSEGAVNVDPKVSGLYYAADRRYNIPKIKEALDRGYNVLIDRYVFSNMAHQSGKPESFDARKEIYEWVEKLEFEMLELPKPDINIFLHMPYEGSSILKENRKEKPDEFEKDKEHGKIAEIAYLEIADRYNFKIFECMDNDKIKTIEEIHEEVYEYIVSMLK